MQSLGEQNGTALRARKVTYGNGDARRVRSLFEAAFPENERVPFWLLMVRSWFKDTLFLSYWDAEVFCGAVFLVTDGEHAFVMYLAVDGTIRSRGYGSRILADLDARLAGQTIMLDIERLDEAAPNAAQRAQRREFYLRNGYDSSGYGLDSDGVSYEIMKKGSPFAPEACECLLNKLSFGWMKETLYPLS